MCLLSLRTHFYQCKPFVRQIEVTQATSKGSEDIRIASLPDFAEDPVQTFYLYPILEFFSDVCGGPSHRIKIGQSFEAIFVGSENIRSISVTDFAGSPVRICYLRLFLE